MKENPQRRGAGCNPGGAEEPEIVDDREYFSTPAAPDTGQLRIGRVCLDRNTTINSPFFWLFLGAAAGAAGAYLLLREKRRG